MKNLNLTWQIPYTIWVAITFILTATIAIFFYFLISVIGGNKTEYWFAFYNRIWMKHWGLICGITQKVIGREKIPLGQSFVFVCNHNSNMDTMVFPRSNIFELRPLAKAEIKKMPVLGYLFSKSAIYVDRTSKESRKKSMDRMQDLINRGISVFLFPEGTRNKTDQPLKFFYDGAFKIAIENQIPIVPIVMTGTKKIMPNDSYWMRPGKTKVIYLGPIPTKGMTMENLEALKQKTFSLMEETFVEHS